MPAVPCAAASLVRDEPLMATASRVRRWLLLEQPGPWGTDAVAESRLDQEVAEALAARARAAGLRVVLIRRPSWQGSTGRLAHLVHSGPRSGWVEELDVEEPGRLLDLPLERLGDRSPPGLGREGPAAVHLVCTHGRHDPCCAERGRPVVRALQEAGTPALWESSHVGGDRFAANLVVLPTGVYYGRVTPEEAPRIVADHAAGLLDLDRYRGRSCFAPLVQAAEVFARRELGERRLDALVVASAARSGDRAHVRLERRDGGALEVLVAREPGEPVQLTCAAVADARPWRYRLEAVREVP